MDACASFICKHKHAMGLVRTIPSVSHCKIKRQFLLLLMHQEYHLTQNNKHKDWPVKTALVNLNQKYIDTHPHSRQFAKQIKPRNFTITNTFEECLGQSKYVSEYLVKHIDSRGNVLNQPIKSFKQPFTCVRTAAHNFPVSGFIHNLQVQYLNKHNRTTSEIQTGEGQGPISP